MYKIGEVAKLIGVRTHTIRFWQSNFEHIKSVNERSKTRYYDAFAIEEFAKIKDLMYTHGVKLSGIKKMISNGKINQRRIKKVQTYANQNYLFNDEESNFNDEKSNVNTYNPDNCFTEQKKDLILKQISEVKHIIQNLLAK